jgi:hypothetical protein
MKQIKNWFNDSFYVEPLSPGCKMCANGSKMVILVTGLCPASCFYCPLSLRKLGKDVIFADEWMLNNEDETEKLIKEAEYIEASGAGITGGDPLMVWRRTKQYISLLKDRFGSDFHIHLYTSGLKNSEHIGELVRAGLDEIRFHPMPKNWGDMNKSPIADAIKDAVDLDVDVAVEIPVLPQKRREIFSLIKWADENNIRWVNLNELEYSETNAKKLNDRGFTVKDDISAAVTGCQQTVENVIKKITESDLDIGAHYCSSSFKDGIQLKNRIKRRAKNIARNYEIITGEGTILKGIITSEKVSLSEIVKTLQDEYAIKSDLIFLNKEKNRVEIPIKILESIATDLKKKNIECYMVEEYPTADALEVERTPMPFKSP